MIDQVTLRELLAYDPDTGVFTWLRSRKGKGRKGAEAGSMFRTATSGPYRIVRVFRKNYYAHRLAWFYMMGEWPPEQIDHKDGNGLNNAWWNLRLASHSQNAMNAKRRRNNTTGYKGVSFNKNTGRYVVSIKVGDKQRFLGQFSSAQKAHAVYCAAAVEYYGEFARSA